MISGWDYLGSECRQRQDEKQELSRDSSKSGGERTSEVVGKTGGKYCAWSQEKKTASRRKEWIDKMEVSNYLHKSNFSGVIGIKTRSTLTEDRMSDEEV